MKRYELVRHPDDGRVTAIVVTPDGRYPLPHIVHHSPSSFEMGYGGSGPADLALAILADWLHEPIQASSLHAQPWESLRLHQDFKSHAIATITAADIDTFLAAHHPQSSDITSIQHPS